MCIRDSLIMMQDWDFPHFTTTLHINLPGFSVATLEWKYAEVHLTGNMTSLCLLNKCICNMIYMYEKFNGVCIFMRCV